MPGVAVFGITGRMGQVLVRLLSGDSDSAATFGLKLSGGTCSSSNLRCGQEAAAEGPVTGVLVTNDVASSLLGAAVAVDFSTSALTVAHAEACARAGVSLLVGTTGLDAAALAALHTASHTIPVLIAPNTSIGMAVMLELVRRATSSLGTAFDVEILECHHRLKRDAPSGTALALGQIVADARGEALSEVAEFDRHGSEQLRRGGSIGFAVLRAGDLVGEHTVLFAGDGERLEITHRATDRALFARGALRAAAWLVGQPPGSYGMENALGLR